MKLIFPTPLQRSQQALLTAGVLALTPLLIPITAQAAPPDHAPAWGNRDQGRDGSRDTNRDGNHPTTVPRYPTVDRTPTTDRSRPVERGRDNDRNGGVDRRPPVDYSRDNDRRDNDRRDNDWRDNDRRDNDRRDNDRGRGNVGITVYGGYGTGGGYGYGGVANYTISGVVTKDATGNQFWVRADNGQGYLVATRYQSAAISPGIRVQVTGYYDGTRLIADSVRVLGYPSPNAPYGGVYGGAYCAPPYSAPAYDTPYGGYGGYQGGWNTGGNEVNFPGYIQSVSYNDGVAFLQVQGDNGQIYNVRFRGTVGLRRGQRVRVIGKYGEGTVWATSLY